MLKYVLPFSVLISLLSCSKSDYQKLVEQELSKGVRHDSLFLDIFFGMSKKDFYTVCWELNSKGVLREGAGNTTAMYRITDLNYPVKMNFYPKFHLNEIYLMSVSFSYEGWSPYNKNLHSDNLQTEVLRLLEDWYSKGFIKVNHAKRGEIYVKVDGNRQITVFKDGDKLVRVLITDLLSPKES